MDEPRIAVFIDYQNCYRLARQQFCSEDAPATHGQFWPMSLAKELAAAGHSRFRLTFVGTYCGVADPRRDPRTAAARHNQIEAWKLNGAHVFTRPLRYPSEWPDSPAEEKGIDVMLAIDLVTMAIRHEYDVGIVASCDTDLVPAVEAVGKLPGSPPAVEVMAWLGRAGRIGTPGQGVPVRQIGPNEYRQIVDLTDYNLRIGLRERRRASR